MPESLHYQGRTNLGYNLECVLYAPVERPGPAPAATACMDLVVQGVIDMDIDEVGCAHLQK